MLQWDSLRVVLGEFPACCPSRRRQILPGPQTRAAHLHGLGHLASSLHGTKHSQLLQAEQQQQVVLVGHGHPRGLGGVCDGLDGAHRAVSLVVEPPILPDDVLQSHAGQGGQALCPAVLGYLGGHGLGVVPGALQHHQPPLPAAAAVIVAPVFRSVQPQSPQGLTQSLLLPAPGKEFRRHSPCRGKQQHVIVRVQPTHHAGPVLRRLVLAPGPPLHGPRLTQRSRSDARALHQRLLPVQEQEDVEGQGDSGGQKGLSIQHTHSTGSAVHLTATGAQRADLPRQLRQFVEFFHSVAFEFQVKGS
mmetsp:Transcript_3915/g.5398  ORF Transcript_3915/g.5398 Transcript_3915/m.5398 type:complete len:303 (-) Transcript_3915:566-1474(-)